MRKPITDILSLLQNIAILILMCTCTHLSAQSTWDGGGGDNNWTTGANWVGDTAPVSGNTLHLIFTGSTRTFPSVDTNYTVNTFEINSSASSFSFRTFSGSTLTFDGTNPTLNHNDNNDQTIDSSLGVILNEDLDVNVTSSGKLFANSIISDDGGNHGIHLSGGGSGRLSLDAVNTYGGETLIDNMMLDAKNNDALGSTTNGTRVINNGLLQVSAGTSGSVTLNSSETITLGDNAGSTSGFLRMGSNSNNEVAGDITVEYDSSINSRSGSGATLTISGGVEVQNGSTLFINNSSSFSGPGLSTVSITGNITESSGSANLTLDEGGTVQLSGNNSYTGTTTVSAGTMDVSGTLYDGTAAGDLVMNGGSVIAQNANILDNVSSGAVDVSMNANGTTLQMGNSFDSNTDGELQFGNLTLTNNSIIDFGSGNAEIRFTGSTITGLTTRTLSIYNWTGTTATPNGTDQLFFDDSLSSSELFNIRFYSDAGSTYLGAGMQFASGEVVPVPEAKSVITTLLLVALAFQQVRKRRR